MTSKNILIPSSLIPTYVGIATLTLLEDPVHIEPIGRTSLIVAAALHIGTQSPGTSIAHNPRGGSTDPV